MTETYEDYMAIECGVDGSTHIHEPSFAAGRLHALEEAAIEIEDAGAIGRRLAAEIRALKENDNEGRS